MSNLSTFYQQNYDGGLNDTASAREIADNQASLLRNWSLRFQGKLSKRRGLLVAGASMGSNPITALKSFLRSNGSRDLLCMEGPNLRYLNGSTWDILGNTFTPGTDFWIEGIQPIDKAYIENEDNTVHSWDRGSVTVNVSLTDLGPSVPHGNVARWHKNHFFHMNNVNVDGVKYPNRLYWSAMGDPATYDTVNDFLEIPGAGRALTMVDLGNSLVLFKERAIQYLSGWGDTDWAITPSSSNVANISEQVGICSPYAAVRVGNEVWFMDHEGQIRRIYQTDFDAYRRDILSTNIQGTLNTINKSQLSKVQAWSNNDVVYFAVPTGTSLVNNLVLAFDIVVSKRNGGAEAWYTITGWNVAKFADFPTSTTPDLYIGDATTGLVYLRGGFNDNGVAIDSRWDGKQHDYKRPERYKRYKFGYIAADSSSNINVPVYASVDSASFAQLGILNVSATGSTLGPTGSFRLGPTGNCHLGGNSQAELKFYYQNGGGAVRGKTVQHSIRHTALNGDPAVKAFTSHYKERELR